MTLSGGQFGEYIDKAYLSNPFHQQSRAPRLDRLYGSDDVHALFGKGKPYDPAVLAHHRKRDPDFQIPPYHEFEVTTPTAPPPWNEATRNASGNRYDASLVNRTIQIADMKDIAEFDPRYLHASQPKITSAGVRHYLQHGQSGPLYADQQQIGNQFPFVYIHQGTGEHRLIGGHHRATAALLKGEPLVARFAVGDY